MSFSLIEIIQFSIKGNLCLVILSDVINYFEFFSHLRLNIIEREVPKIYCDLTYEEELGHANTLIIFSLIEGYSMKRSENASMNNNFKAEK